MIEVATKLTVQVTDRDGTRHEVEWEPSQSLMEALRDNDMAVLASCGGNCVCATCHVYVDAAHFQATGERSADERELLEATSCFKPAASRLSCQVRHCEELAGIAVVLAPYD